MKSYIRHLFILSLGIFVLIFWFTMNVCAVELGERTLRYKDEGSDVAILQFRLQETGYYHESVDGIFGKKTYNAVIRFQKDNNLVADGVVGSKTFQILPKSDKLPSRGQFTWDDLMFLARVIHAEARGEPYKGQVAVGSVILNRVDSDMFPNVIREVILQEGQFCTMADGQVHLYPSNTSIEAAKAAIFGYDPSYGALFFYNPWVASKRNWVASRAVSIRIGAHIFAY
ncbi:MAG: cell wall hydrolase [Halanaerobiales bacterium]|nr:cell wall hydrolase [Halanaerobiales bacterium]